MKFEFRNGLIWLSIELEYENELMKIDNCILDTGSATTAVDIDQINFNYQKPTKIKRLFGIGCGVQEVVCQQIDSFGIDTFFISEIDIEFPNRYRNRYST